MRLSSRVISYLVHYVTKQCCDRCIFCLNISKTVKEERLEESMQLMLISRLGLPHFTGDIFTSY